MLLKNRYASIFEALVYVFTICLFLALGVDRYNLHEFRQGFFIILFLAFLPLVRKSTFLTLLRSKSWLFFFLFLIFEVLRALWGIVGLTRVEPDSAQSALFERYLYAPFPWFCYFGLFTIFFLVNHSRKISERLLLVFAGSSFFLAMNVLPPLFQKGKMGYLSESGKYFVFHPSFYFIKEIKYYLISDYAHINYVGDIIAIGFFSALGIFSYAVIHWIYQRQEGRASSFPLVKSGISLPVMGVCVLAVFLLFSRGAILSFSLAFLFFLTMVLLKFRTKKQFFFLALLGLIMAGFLIWAGDLKSVWSELATLQQEVETAEEGSSAANLEGGKRALRIYAAYPFWGAGGGGYEALSRDFATPETYASLILVRFKAMCHYLQILAEEGVGSFFYFLFLIFFIGECLREYWKSQSRYQALIGIALTASTAMILVHAVINHLMQQFNMSLLVYLLMGACLGILRSDFKH